ncbi:unnamed protein product, partial [Rotaria sp. Silwood2]
MGNERNPETTHVMFLLCTDEPDSVEHFTQWDQTMKNVDVIDDFPTEREKIRRYRGPDFRFSRGDYVVKALIGAVDPEIDKLDEPIPLN